MTAPSVAAPAASKRDITLMFIGLMTAMLLSSLDQTMFATALPTIVGDLGGADQMLWVTTAYILAATVMMPVYGNIGDRIGRKGLLICAIGLFMVGSVVGALAPGMPELIAGRAIQGLGGGGLMVLSQAIIADVIPARERGRYMGVLGSVFAFSSIAGPLIGGGFADSIGWQWCLWINIPTGLLAIGVVYFFLHVPRHTRPSTRADYPGMILLAIATTCLVLTTSWGGRTYDWISPQILGLAAAVLVFAIAFIAVERRAESPILPLGLFRQRNFTLTTIAGLLLGIAMFGTLTYMPTYMQMVTGVSATVAGLLLTPMMGGMLIMSIWAGRRITKTGRYKRFPVIGSALVALALGLMSTMVYDEPLWLTCLYLLFMGIGLGLTMQNLVLIVQNAFPVSIVGTATAANNYFRQIGASLGAAVVGSVFTSRLVSLLIERAPADVDPSHVDFNTVTPDAVAQLPDPYHDIVVSSYNDALAPVFGWIAPLALVACALLLAIREVPLQTHIDRTSAADALDVHGVNDMDFGGEARRDTAEIAKISARGEAKPG